MGFDQLTPTAATQIARSLPNLNILNIYIYSVRLANNKSWRGDGINRAVPSNLLLSVPLTAAYGCINNWISTGLNERGTIIYPREEQVSTIDIQLCNEWGNVLQTELSSNNYLEFLVYY
jgi:hypothetical protein